MVGAAIGSTWLTNNVDSATYLAFDTNEKWNSSFGLVFIQMTGTWILIFT